MISDIEKRKIEDAFDKECKEKYMLLKFSNKIEYSESLKRGELYLNTVQYFIDLENNTNIRGMGDKNELKYSMPYMGIRIHDPVTRELSTEIRTSGYVQREKDLSYPLFCMTGYQTKELIKCWNGDELQLMFPISDKQMISIENDFGKYVSVFTEDAFFNRLNKAVKGQSIQYKFLPIHYCEYNDIHKAIAHFQGSWERFFYKDSDLSYQHEVRILFEMELPENHIFQIDAFKDDNSFGIIKSADLKNYKISIKNNLVNM